MVFSEIMAPSPELDATFFAKQSENIEMDMVSPFKTFQNHTECTKRESGEYREIFRIHSINPGDYLSIRPP